ncbi:hypothetical protein JGU66_18615 [Myxococcaceae bacterium JPH2]|nr:hypothetical protein [Myxococcaceae bacterium JPH2]
MAEAVWDYIDRHVAEFRRVQLLVRAVRGGRFKGCKPNGSWWVRFGTGRNVRNVVTPTPMELVLQVAVLRCGTCGHKTSGHKEAERDEGTCSTRCDCARSRADIARHQSTAAWIAAQAGLTESEVFRGIRGVTP